MRNTPEALSSGAGRGWRKSVRPFASSFDELLAKLDYFFFAGFFDLAAGFAVPEPDSKCAGITNQS